MIRFFGIEWVMLGSIVDLLFCWYHWLRKHSLDIWDLVLGCLMWTIWTEWNRRSFEDEGKTMVQLLEFCQRTLFDWSRCWVIRIVLPFWIFCHLLEQIRGCFCLFVSSFPLFTTVKSLCFFCFFFFNNIPYYLSKKSNVPNPKPAQAQLAIFHPSLGSNKWVSR